MGRIYAVTYNGTITNAGGNTDLVSLQPADDKPIRLRGMVLGNISDVGDAQAEGLRITVKRMPATFTVGSGGSAVTATKPLGDRNGNTWGFTARANDTTIATTSGTAEALGEFGWIIQNSPFDFWWPDRDFAPQAAQTDGLVITCETTPADDFTASLTFFVEEE
jgi:hypothetical protein